MEADVDSNPSRISWNFFLFDLSRMSTSFQLNLYMVVLGLVFFFIGLKSSTKMGTCLASCGFTLIILGFLELIGPMIIEQAYRH